MDIYRQPITERQSVIEDLKTRNWDPPIRNLNWGCNPHLFELRKCFEKVF